ncbi:unnamed protein product [Ostreobium quekettii]|uniref:Secreted protein n=1 Tax=Ostreobium quekettii TaxID=121088 RepID=A0A8S1J0T6_9CHLO|nr:unnamed protein product [Ostreobium quekettii]|eukprot:evm.model.scf_2076.1 EVM.evm.TU.scf_2076.1   scf_2076:17010-17375(+)
MWIALCAWPVSILLQAILLSMAAKQVAHVTVVHFVSLCALCLLLWCLCLCFTYCGTVLGLVDYLQENSLNCLTNPLAQCPHFHEDSPHQSLLFFTMCTTDAFVDFCSCLLCGDESRLVVIN